MRLIITLTVIHTVVSLKHKQLVPNLAEGCKEVKCPPVEAPECARVTRRDMNSTVYVLALNKCELDFTEECDPNLKAEIVPMEFCGHTFEIGEENQNNMLQTKTPENKKDVNFNQINSKNLDGRRKKRSAPFLRIKPAPVNKSHHKQYHKSLAIWKRKDANFIELAADFDKEPTKEKLLFIFAIIPWIPTIITVVDVVMTAIDVYNVVQDFRVELQATTTTTTTEIPPDYYTEEETSYYPTSEEQDDDGVVLEEEEKEEEEKDKDNGDEINEIDLQNALDETIEEFSLLIQPDPQTEKLKNPILPFIMGAITAVDVLEPWSWIHLKQKLDEESSEEDLEVSVREFLMKNGVLYRLVTLEPKKQKLIWWTGVITSLDIWEPWEWPFWHILPDNTMKKTLLQQKADSNISVKKSIETFSSILKEVKDKKMLLVWTRWWRSLFKAVKPLADPSFWEIRILNKTVDVNPDLNVNISMNKTVKDLTRLVKEEPEQAKKVWWWCFWEWPHWTLAWDEQKGPEGESKEDRINEDSASEDISAFPLMSVETINKIKAGIKHADRKEYDALCPSMCPTRDVSVCGKCRHGVYRTFLSVCHMRMFTCRYRDEGLQLVSRHACVASAPYLAGNAMKPKGCVVEPRDDDIVLRYIMCRDRAKLGRAVQQDDPRCNINP